MRTPATLLIRIVVVAVTLLATASPASAQLDPLLFLKNQSMNVLIAIDTGNRMQRDADQTYYDPLPYAKDVTLLAALDLLDANVSASYRRKFPLLAHQESAGNDRFLGPNVLAVGDRDAAYGTFYERTRLAVARRGVLQAMQDNSSSARFGLIRMRQSSPALPNTPNYAVKITDDVDQVATGDAGGGKWNINRPTVAQDNGTTATSGLLVSPDAVNAFTTVSDWLTRDFSNGGLIPAGRDDKVKIDAPIGLMLDDARTEAARLIGADATGCRNTIVVLIAGGGEGSTNANLTTKANAFLNVASRRVPIYVIAIAPATDAERTALRAVATESGGQFFEITKAMIEATTPGQPVADIVRAINTAVQHTYVTSTAFNTGPTAALPYGPQTEFQVTSPVVGTVNLKGAYKYNLTTGAYEPIPDQETDIVNAASGDARTKIPLRSNVLVTTAFALPGFDGRLRAVRVYRPEPDSTKPSGYRFTQDGSRLWVASVPAAASRNIYTILPGSSDMVKFETGNVASLSTYLGVTDPSTLIDWIRNQPLGAVVGSTPAFADPPSLDPPPDAAYPGFAAGNAKRRSLIYIGANDGMIHAIDSRTGVEVWAFIPFNLLPKLKVLRNGQSLDAFKYYVDSSPKIADVKIGSDWKTYLFFGQGPGGTYYNALDITLAGMSVSDESNDMTALLNYFASEPIKWRWSFPLNSHFDHTIAPYGDVALTADAIEKSVGETWSDPAVGQVSSEDGPYVMLVGSGFLRRSVENQANRAGARGGTTFYVLDVSTGSVLQSRDVGADSHGEDDDNCKTAGNCGRIKNALQMDPVATGPTDSRYVTKAYIGDLDGKVWRFNLSLTAANAVSMAAPVQLFDAGRGYPLFASMAYVNVGGSNEYIFVGTGSDLLPSTGVNQSYSMLVLKDNGGSATKTAEILLDRTDGTAPDEKVTAFPAVAGDIVFFATTSIDPAAPCSPFTGNLYAFTFVGGPAYDTNNDGTLTSTTSASGKKGGGGAGATADSVKVYSKAGARATSPFIVDQHLVFSLGGELQMFGDPDDFNNGVGQAGVRILSWRMVR